MQDLDRPIVLEQYLVDGVAYLRRQRSEERRRVWVSGL